MLSHKDSTLEQPPNLTMEAWSLLHNRKIPAPCFVDRKYDGELNVLHVFSNGIYLVNKYGKVRYSCPITNAFNSRVTMKILGELYWGIGKNGNLYDLLRFKESDILQFAMFDILEYDKRDLTRTPLIERRELLASIASERLQNKQAHLVYSEFATSWQEAHLAVQENRDQGWEGVVIKGAQGIFNNGANWLKIKHTTTWDMEVAYIDPSKERIEVILPLQAGNCGVKVMNKVKQTLKPGDIVEIKHYGVLSGGSLRHPSFVRLRTDKTQPSYV